MRSATLITASPVQNIGVSEATLGMHLSSGEQNLERCASILSQIEDAFFGSNPQEVALAPEMQGLAPQIIRISEKSDTLADRLLRLRDRIGGI